MAGHDGQRGHGFSDGGQGQHVTPGDGGEVGTLGRWAGGARCSPLSAAPLRLRQPQQPGRFTYQLAPLGRVSRVHVYPLSE